MLLDLLDTFAKGKPHRNAALYDVAFRCGLRQAELLGLRWKDVDLDRRVLHVAGQLKDKAHAALGHSNLDRQFDALLRRAKLPDVRFHDMRHTYVALSIAAGVDLYTLSRRVGHSSIAVTAAIYLHSYDDTKRAAVAGAARLLRRKVG